MKIAIADNPLCYISLRPRPIPGYRARGKRRGFSPEAAVRRRGRTRVPWILTGLFPPYLPHCFSKPDVQRRLVNQTPVTFYLKSDILLDKDAKRSQSPVSRTQT